MIYDNEFNCPDGHIFKANAKIRARCPDCGKMARRTYTKEPITTPSPDGVAGGDSPALPLATPKEEDRNKVKLIRQGRFSMAKRSTPPKDANGRFISSKKLTPAKKTAKKKVTVPVTKKNTLVSKTRITNPKVTPKVRKAPARTAVARHINGGGGQKSYADEMMERSRLW